MTNDPTTPKHQSKEIKQIEEIIDRVYMDAKKDSLVEDYGFILEEAVEQIETLILKARIDECNYLLEHKLTEEILKPSFATRQKVRQRIAELTKELK